MEYKLNLLQLFFYASPPPEQTGNGFSFSSPPPLLAMPEMKEFAAAHARRFDGHMKLPSQLKVDLSRLKEILIRLPV
jgi:hypothetical protein